MAVDQPDDPGQDPVTDEGDGGVSLDELAGEELFEIPADLDDEPGTGAPAPGADADPAQGGPPAAKPGAPQPRKEDGTFAEKPKDEPAAAEGQPPAPVPAGEPSDAPQAGAPPAAAADAEPELEFSFRADGQPIQIKGSKVTAEGILIPKQYQADFQRLLSYGVTYQGSHKRRVTELAQALENTRSEVHEEVERSKAYLDFFADLCERQDRGEPAIEEWLDNFRENRVKLEAAADLAAAKAFRERKPAEVRLPEFDADPAAEDGPTTTEDIEELSRSLAPEFDTRIQKIIRTENIRGLTGAEITRIRDWMIDPRRLGQFVRVALEDIPAADWGGGYDVKKGDRISMDGDIAAEFKYQAGLILDARKSGSALKAAELANARNGGNQIPPVVPVAGGGAPKGVKQVPKFKNKAEMDAWYEAEDPLS